MRTVHKSTGKTQSKFKDQTFFDDFNWENFTVGDIVWLEDYHTEREADKIAGVFTGYKNGNEPVIRLIPNRYGEILARNNSETILSYNSWWKRYLDDGAAQ